MKITNQNNLRSLVLPQLRFTPQNNDKILLDGLGYQFETDINNVNLLVEHQQYIDFFTKNITNEEIIFRGLYQIFSEVSTYMIETVLDQKDVSYFLVKNFIHGRKNNKDLLFQIYKYGLNDKYGYEIDMLVGNTHFMGGSDLWKINDELPSNISSINFEISHQIRYNHIEMMEYLLNLRSVSRPFIVQNKMITTSDLLPFMFKLIELSVNLDSTKDEESITLTEENDNLLISVDYYQKHFKCKISLGNRRKFETEFEGEIGLILRKFYFMFIRGFEYLSANELRREFENLKNSEKINNNESTNS